jgi:xylulokinase
MKFAHKKRAEQFVVGLDCSSTGTKAIALERNGTVEARACKTISLSSPQPAYHEQDSNDWWISTRNA